MTRTSITGLICAMLLVGCTKDFTTINTNPNAAVDVQPEALLRQVVYDYGEQMSYEGFVAGNLLGQYLTAIDFNLFDRHSLTEPQFGGNPWDVLYLNLRDTEILLDKSISNPAFAVYEGPARVMKAYIAATITDIYGDVPYTEAADGKAGNVAPVYDDQEEIYTGENGIIAQLESAVEAIDKYAGNTTLSGDLLYHGDLSSWRAFANSLRFKYLMRISDKADVRPQLTALLIEGDLILEAGQNAAFDFSGAPPNNFRMANLRTGDFNLFIMSQTIEDILKGYNDPRIGILFRPAGNNADVYNGLLNGPDPSQLSISVADFSLAGEIFRENTGALDANFLTSWEMHFLIAEAAFKGMVPADARTHYELAVLQAFEYWHTDIPSTYLTDGAAAYGSNGASPLEQIITQKWLGNIINGYEGWIEFRRTGFPQLRTISASLNDDRIPVRMPYPTDEASLNTVNFAVAAAGTDGNSINSRVWWDVD